MLILNSDYAHAVELRVGIVIWNYNERVVYQASPGLGISANFNPHVMNSPSGGMGLREKLW